MLCLCRRKPPSTGKMLLQVSSVSCYLYILSLVLFGFISFILKSIWMNDGSTDMFADVGVVPSWAGSPKAARGAPGWGACASPARSSIPCASPQGCSPWRQCCLAGSTGTGGSKEPQAGTSPLAQRNSSQAWPLLVPRSLWMLKGHPQIASLKMLAGLLNVLPSSSPLLEISV